MSFGNVREGRRCRRKGGAFRAPAQPKHEAFQLQLKTKVRNPDFAVLRFSDPATAFFVPCFMGLSGAPVPCCVHSRKCIRAVSNDIHILSRNVLPHTGMLNRMP